MLGDRFVLVNGPPRKGGMGEIRKAVYLSNCEMLVAVKFLTASRIADDRIVRMAFNRELKALKTVDHPSVVTIVYFEPHADPPYLVLEWLDRDLNAQLLLISFADWNDYYERLGKPVLDPLSYALGKELVHRDVKPGNILFDQDGTPKVVDFGISAFRTDVSGGMTFAAYKLEKYAPHRSPQRLIRPRRLHACGFGPRRPARLRHGSRRCAVGGSRFDISRGCLP